MRMQLLLTLITCALAPPVQTQYGSSAAADFWPPHVEFIDNDYGATFGAQLFHELIPDPETFIRDVCDQVYHVLYDGDEDAPRVTDITYYLEDYDGISVTWGSQPHVYIRYSTRWIQTTWQNSGGDNDAVLYETTGVLCHELTHAYQQNGNQIPGHAIEGMADAVRTALGYLPYANRQPGGSYTDSYQRTGFFLDWLDQERFPAYNVLRRLNQAADPQINRPWSWDLVQAMTGWDVDTLWAEYQSFLQSALSASFTFASQDANRRVVFEDKSISVMPVTSRRWDFGDGTTSTQRNPQHTYAQDGDYAVSLTVSATYGSDVQTHIVSVPPTIPYGQSLSEDCTTEWIAEVTVGEMVNASERSNYSDCTDLVAQVHSDETYPVVVHAGYVSRPYPGAHCRIWIDYDGDRMFNDQEELVFDSGYSDQTRMALP